ncbi:MAG: ATP-binding protein [Bacteroidota bacterium]
MLLEFTVGNFLSFKEPVTLSLEASSITDFPENVFSKGRTTLLKSVAIYGANASGKSNLIAAISRMRSLVKSSAKLSSTDEIFVEPFLLSTEMSRQPCHFEILFLLDEVRYRYGFEVAAAKVHTEWLYQSKANAEKPLFIRDGSAIEVSAKFSEGKNLEGKTRENALFLSVCDQFNGEISKKIMGWFSNGNTISGLNHENYRGVTFRLLSDPDCKPAILEFLEKLDLGFGEVRVEEEEFNSEKLPEEMPLATRLRLASDLKGKKMLRFKTLHDLYNPAGEKTGQKEFDLDTQESSGTNKVFDLLGPVFDTLMNGKVLVVDELDAKLHPLLTKALVSLFNSVETNPNNAQLVFATHDTNLLTYGNFRRDQIYFVEKDRQGATNLYSLLEYKEEGKTVRADRSFEKDYVQGRYGAIPFLGDFSKLFFKWQEHQKSPIK